MDLKSKRVLITGVGVKPIQFVFKDKITSEPSHTEITADGQKYKANIGSATALACARVGAVVHIVSQTESKLRIVKKWIEETVPHAHGDVDLWIWGRS